MHGPLVTIKHQPLRCGTALRARDTSSKSTARSVPHICQWPEWVDTAPPVSPRVHPAWFACLAFMFSPIFLSLLVVRSSALATPVCLCPGVLAHLPRCLLRCLLMCAPQSAPTLYDLPHMRALNARNLSLFLSVCVVCVCVHAGIKRTQSLSLSLCVWSLSLSVCVCGAVSAWLRGCTATTPMCADPSLRRLLRQERILGAASL